MAYTLMTKLINKHLEGNTKYTQDVLDEKLDVYYAASRLTTEQYNELHTLLHSKEA